MSGRYKDAARSHRDALLEGSGHPFECGCHRFAVELCTVIDSGDRRTSNGLVGAQIIQSRIASSLPTSELSAPAVHRPPWHLYGGLMGSRLFAAVIILAGIGLLAWAALGNNSTNDTDVVAAAATTAAPAGASTSDTAMSNTDDATPEPASTQVPEVELKNFGPRRQLLELDGWLNTDISSLDELDGKVVLVEMWTFGCHNCKARIPHNQGFYESYDRENFEIVGVHAPEFSYEADVANIEKALVDLGVTWPIALDTNKKNFRVWQEGTTNYWPRTFLIDQNGDIRFDHIGEGKYNDLQQAIESLLNNPPAAKT